MTTIQTATVEDMGSRWIRVGKTVGKGVVSVGIQKTEARATASAVLESIERWAVDGLTRTTTIPALMGGEILTVTVTPRGGVRLAYRLPDGDERYLHLTQAEAADVALALAEMAQ